MKSFTLTSAALVAAAACLAATPAHAATTQSFVAGTFTRQSVSPDACKVPESCSYQCAAAYNLEISGTSLKATPTNANPSASCTCYTLSMTVGSDGVASGSAGGNNFLLKATSTGISVDATVDGVTCSGSYSGNTASTTTSGATSVSTAVSAALVAGTVVAATALTVAGFV